MKYLVSGKQMKEIDRYTIEEIGIPSLVLMERAAMKVAEEIEKIFAHLSKTKNPALHADKDEILAVCGNGNNGADGVATARMLKQKGYCVSVLLAGTRDKGTKETERWNGSTSRATLGILTPPERPFRFINWETEMSYCWTAEARRMRGSKSIFKPMGSGW